MSTVWGWGCNCKSGGEPPHSKWGWQNGQLAEEAKLRYIGKIKGIEARARLIGQSPFQTCPK
jgi:hypothetical protein